MDAALHNTYWRIVQIARQGVSVAEGRREPQLVLSQADGQTSYRATAGVRAALLRHYIAAMTLRWILAFLHLMALPIGLAAVYLRARSLRTLTPSAAVKADMWWGIAAFIWISTGIVRWLVGTEKPMPYYTANWLFHTKMMLLLLILVLEVRPIVVIGRWRSALRRGDPLDTSAAPAMATTSYIQLVLAVLMVIAATGMARGIGVFG